MQIDLTPITSILGLISVIFGFIYSVSTIRRFIHARKLSIFLEFHKLSYNLEFIQDMNEILNVWTWESVEDFLEKYGPVTNSEAFARYTRVGSYFDGLGTLVQKKLVDKSFIPETTAISVISFWEKMEPWVDELSTLFRRPEAYDSIKFLYDSITKIDRTERN